MRFYAKRQTSDYCSIIIDDGGIVEMHYNEEHWVTTYFQDRCNSMLDDDMWVLLADSKQYVKSWEDKTNVDDFMIYDALKWLDPMCDEFTEIDLEKLTNIIKQNT